jgi:uncharacterized membrane protein YvbJ
MIKKICKNCGHEFEAKTNRALFCSSNCRAASHMRKKRKKLKKWYKRIDLVHISLFVMFLLAVLYILFLK